MSDEHLGSCLCGTVRFRIDGAFEHFYLCQCQHCRKDSGSAHSANLFSNTARLSWLSGQDNVTVYNLPRTRHTKSFCATCGSALPYTMETLLVVPAGSLDSPLSITPDARIFSASKADWHQDFANLPSFDGYPS
jgi:hypothetical protein